MIKTQRKSKIQGRELTRLYLEEEAEMRLKVAAAISGLSMGDLVSRLALKTLPGIPQELNRFLQD